MKFPLIMNQHWLIFVIPTLLFHVVEANLRCYSCAPCNELEIYAGDVTHFEQDCYLDRYCMKVSVIGHFLLLSFDDLLDSDFRHYRRHFWLQKRSVCQRVSFDFIGDQVGRRMHWNFITSGWFRPGSRRSLLLSRTSV